MQFHPKEDLNILAKLKMVPFIGEERDAISRISIRNKVERWEILEGSDIFTSMARHRLRFSYSTLLK
jgi:hypothetical protein